MVYISRDANNNINGVYVNPQPGYATEFVADNDPSVIAYLAPPQMVKTQDLLAQFTPTDIGSIQTAISSNTSMLLLWYSFLGQSDPMTVKHARFQAGWQALIQTLGQPRMTAIANTLNITP